MARIWQSGAELGDISLRAFSQYGALSTITSSPRNGSRYFAFAGFGNATIALPGIYAELYQRHGYKQTYYQAVAPSFRTSYREGSTVHILITYDYADQKVRVYRGATLIATSALTWRRLEWMCIEHRVKVDDGEGIVQVKVNGVLFIDFAGDTRNGGTIGQIDNIYYSQDNYMHSGLDDIAINDTSGSRNNSWPGNGFTVLQTPNGNGDVSQLVGQDLDQVDNYQNVDDLPHDGDTTYNQSATADQYDLYAVTPSGLAGTNYTINAVKVCAIAKLGEAGTGAVKSGVKSGEAESWGDAKALPSDVYELAETIIEDDPATGSEWNIAAVDAMQIGAKVA